ncbi:MAG: DegQ family serine endoprotease [Thiotrichaceae bacterium]|nr:DegQ family serine endoprotease [Thiotrichaceae bacterium]
MKKLQKLLIQGLALLLPFSAVPSDAALPVSVDGQALPSLAPMLENVTPAVVNISTRTRIRVQENPLLNDPFFRRFFQLPDQPRERQSQSLGSGVIINAREGLVVTNSHVIAKADEISVTLRDGRSFNAQLIGADADTDIAVIKIKAERLSALPLANSDKLRVGDFVVAIGNPFGLGQTVTSGIVSALGRSGLGIEGYEDFIQTDASINPGNSGGALVNLRGELVGINTAILSPNGGSGNVGIGFAIPMNMANKIVNQLNTHGKVQRGSLGMQLQNLSPELAQAFGLRDQQGVVVARIEQDSPAEQAGLQSGDIILSMDRQAVTSVASARNRIGLLGVGDTVEIQILRKGKPLTIQAVIGKTSTHDGAKISNYLEGVSLIDSSEGIEIQSVDNNSFAATVGIQPKDYIIGVNQRAVKNIAELTKRMQQISTPFMLQLRRENAILSLWLQ